MILKQEMLQILTIAVRQIIHAFESAIKNSQILMLQQDYLSKKGGKTSGSLWIKKCE